MNDTVFLKWLTCADEGNYVADTVGTINMDARKASLNASLKVMSYLIFVNNITQFCSHNENGTTTTDTSNAITSFAVDTNDIDLNLHVAHGIGMLANPEGLTYHFFCTSAKGLLLDNSGRTTSSEVDLISKGGTIPTIISIKTSNVTDTKDFILFNKNDSLKSNEKGCNNFCHIMKFFGGISNYQCVLYSKGKCQ